jgi:hypothetical protein
MQALFVLINQPLIYGHRALNIYERADWMSFRRD